MGRNVAIGIQNFLRESSVLSDAEKQYFVKMTTEMGWLDAPLALS